MTTSIERNGGWRFSPWRILLWLIPTGLLLTPAVAMQFSRDVQWGPVDFVFMGVLLYGCTWLVDLAMRKQSSTAYRLGAAIVVLTSFLLVWVNAAVGVIGDEGNPANLVFIAIILMVVAGAVVARFRADGLSRSLLLAAGAHAIVAVVALIAGAGADEPPGAVGMFMLNGVFVALWLVSGGLFRAASRA